MTTFLTNLFKGAIKKGVAATQNKYKKIGLSWLQARRLKNLPESSSHSIPLYDGSIQFYHRYELLHSIDEIFFKEIYKTDFDNSAPLIYDCGANIGLSVIYLKKHYPSARIVAFEPDEYNYKLLSENIQSMRLSGVELRKQAVWVQNTRLNFQQEGTMSSRVNASNHSGEANVEAIRLKELLQHRIDLLKMDIEGAEYQVIKDIEDKLYLIDRIFLEYHGSFEENYKLEELLHLLTKHQFFYYITEANQVYPTPFYRQGSFMYDVQLNIYCFKKRS